MSSILVVEDNPIFRQTLVESLNREFSNFEILQAGEGKEALKIMGELRPFLVFMDIGLPGENGLALTKMIKDSYPETAVAILTSSDVPEYREAAQRSGASHFLCKWSVSVQEVLRVVDSLPSPGNGGDPSNGRDANVPLLVRLCKLESTIAAVDSHEAVLREDQ
jgi:DNA-binding NarL/FixJ family response regulator